VLNGGVLWVIDNGRSVPRLPLESLAYFRTQLPEGTTTVTSFHKITRLQLNGIGCLHAWSITACSPLLRAGKVCRLDPFHDSVKALNNRQAVFPRWVNSSWEGLRHSCSTFGYMRGSDHSFINSMDHCIMCQQVRVLLTTSE
jgi:hypothetical protein